MSPEQAQLGNRSVREFTDYLKGLLQHRRQHPGDPAHDVLTRLFQGQGEGEPLSEAPTRGGSARFRGGGEHPV